MATTIIVHLNLHAKNQHATVFDKIGGHLDVPKAPHNQSQVSDLNKLNRSLNANLNQPGVFPVMNLESVQYSEDCDQTPIMRVHFNSFLSRLEEKLLTIVGQIFPDDSFNIIYDVIFTINEEDCYKKKPYKYHARFYGHHYRLTGLTPDTTEVLLDITCRSVAKCELIVDLSFEIADELALVGNTITLSKNVSHTQQLRNSIAVISSGLNLWLKTHGPLPTMHSDNSIVIVDYHSFLKGIEGKLLETLSFLDPLSKHKITFHTNYIIQPSKRMYFQNWINSETTWVSLDENTYVRTAH